jgi:hypothetical protein
VSTVHVELAGAAVGQDMFSIAHVQSPGLLEAFQHGVGDNE